MSKENTETVLAMCEALNSMSKDGLEARLVQFFDPGIEWHDVPTLPGAGVYFGYAAYRQHLEDYLEAWAQVNTQVEEIRSVGSRVVARIRYRGIGKGSTAPVVGAWSGPATGAIFEFRN
jgi:hypothetical protein